MIEYGSLAKGYLTYPGKNLKMPDGRVISNPREETLKGTGFALDEVMLFNGYKPIVKVDRPAQKEGYHFNSEWKEEEKRIVQTWNEAKDPEPTQTHAIDLDQEALDILRGVYDDEL